MVRRNRLCIIRYVIAVRCFRFSRLIIILRRRYRSEYCCAGRRTGNTRFFFFFILQTRTEKKNRTLQWWTSNVRGVYCYTAGPRRGKKKNNIKKELSLSYRLHHYTRGPPVHASALRLRFITTIIDMCVIVSVLGRNEAVAFDRKKTENRSFSIAGKSSRIWGTWTRISVSPILREYKNIIETRLISMTVLSGNYLVSVYTPSVTNKILR